MILRTILAFALAMVLFLSCGRENPVSHQEQGEYVFLIEWGTEGFGDGQFQIPEDLALDSLGNVYVVDGETHCAQKFTSDGTFLAKWGTLGDGDGQFYEPESIAVDDLGNVYVADSENHRVQKFTSEGVFLNKWGTRGHGNGEFSYPRGIAADRKGNVYVIDISGRIQKFEFRPTDVLK